MALGTAAYYERAITQAQRRYLAAVRVLTQVLRLTRAAFGEARQPPGLGPQLSAASQAEGRQVAVAG
jgi:hypothetical protein